MSTKDNENLGSPEVFVTGIVFGCIAGIAVLCKAYTKTIVKTHLGWDDLWILCALLCFWVEDILQLYSMAGLTSLLRTFRWLTISK